MIYKTNPVSFEVKYFLSWWEKRVKHSLKRTSKKYAAFALFAFIGFHELLRLYFMFYRKVQYYFCFINIFESYFKLFWNKVSKIFLISFYIVLK